MSASSPAPGRLGRSPAVRRNGQWWLVSDTGAIAATDTAFAAMLDSLARALDDAEHAVARLRAVAPGSSAPESGEHR